MNYKKHNQVRNHYLSKVEYDVTPSDYQRLEDRIQLIEQLTEVQNTSVVVYDFYKQDYLFRNIRFSDHLGHDKELADELGLSYFSSLIHPDDYPVILDTHIKAFTFLHELPPEEKKDYKLIYTFRSKGKDGNYYVLVDQIAIMELDRSGNIWLILGITDMMPTQYKIDTPERQLLNMKNKMLYMFNENDQYEGKPVLSAREIEVLGLVSKGYASKSIAQQLCISINTVNNHRQKILEKTNTANTAEAVALARNLGFV